MKYYIIAGEASGDLHGSNLIKELIKLDKDAQIRAWGGDLMQKAGAQIVKHYKELAFMGFVEVLSNLRTILKNIKFCKKDVLEYRPDVLLLIDYPGFNLRIAKWAKKQGIRVVYYIAPQVWAWKENRVPLMKQSIDKMMTILPFEKAYFQNKWQWQVDYVGHPLTKVVADFLHETPSSTHEKIIALLPGSRKQEIAVKLPIMLRVTKNFPDYTFVLAQAPSLEDDFYQPFLAAYPNVKCMRNNTYTLLAKSTAALVTSGTATLETALFGVPQVVCYKGNNLSYYIAKKLIKVKYISLVNLIMDKPVVTELIQHDLTPEKITEALHLILHNPSHRKSILADYATLKNVLQAGGNASETAAKTLYAFAQQ